MIAKITTENGKGWELFADKEVKKSVLVPICTMRARVSNLGTFFPLAMQTLSVIYVLRILGRRACGISLNVIKLDPAPVSRISTKTFLNRTVGPRFA